MNRSAPGHHVRPIAQCGGAVARRGALAPARREPGVDGRERGRGVAVQADGGFPLPLQLAGVDVDAHERAREMRCRRAGRVEVVGLAELRADGEHDVGLGEGGVHGPQRQRGAEAEGMAVGHDALGVDRQADRRAEALGDRGGLVARGHGAAAEQQHRALGRGQQLDGALDERRVGDRGLPARRQSLRGRAGQVEHVDRDADVHGARAPRLEDLEGPGERLGQLGGVADVDRLGRDGGHERALVGKVVQGAVPAAVVTRSPWRWRSRASGSSRGRRRRSAWRRS